MQASWQHCLLAYVGVHEMPAAGCGGAGAVVMGGQGLQVLSPDGNLFFSKPSVVRSSEEYESVSQGRAADWVILALKSTSFKEVRSTTTTTSRLEGKMKREQDGFLV